MQLAQVQKEVISVADRLSGIKFQLWNKFRFFAYLIEHMNCIEDNSVGTAAVDRYGRLYYNTAFVNKLSDKELVGLLCHEVLHLALKHPDRSQGRNAYVNGINLWNAAIDIVVNYTVLKNELSLPAGGIIPEIDNEGSIDIFGCTIDIIEKRSAEDIYDMLRTQLKENGAKEQRSSGGSGNSGPSNEDGESEDGDGDGNEDGNEKESQSSSDKDSEEEKEKNKRGGFDCHRFDKDQEQENGSVRKDGKTQKKLREINWDGVIQVAMNHAKQAGQTPAGFGREFDVYQKGFINWRSILSRIVASCAQKSYSWSLPDKRLIPFDIYIPHVVGEKAKVLFSIDTSGSISKEELSKYFTEIISLSKSFDDVELRVLTHDVEVHDDYYVANGNIAKIKSLVPHGGGGTSHNELYAYIEKKKYNRGNNLLISMTDGYSDYPEKPSIDTIFVLAGSYSIQSLPPWKKKVIELL